MDVSPDQVYAAMQAIPAHAEGADEACTAVTQLCRGTSEAAIVNRRLAVEFGVFGMVARVTNEHVTSRRVVRAACELAECLCNDDTPDGS